MRKYSFNNNKIYGGPIEEIFGSDDGFTLFLNGMGFNLGIYISIGNPPIALTLLSKHSGRSKDIRPKIPTIGKVNTFTQTMPQKSYLSLPRGNSGPKHDLTTHRIEYSSKAEYHQSCGIKLYLKLFPLLYRTKADTF